MKNAEHGDRTAVSGFIDDNCRNKTVVTLIITNTSVRDRLHEDKILTQFLLLYFKLTGCLQ